MRGCVCSSPPWTRTAVVSDVQQSPVPISVLKADVATAQGKQFVYSVTLLMRGGSQRVAIGVRDDFGAQASFLSRELTVGPVTIRTRKGARDARMDRSVSLAGRGAARGLAGRAGTLQDDFQRSGRHLGVALGLFGAAAMLAFWILGLILFVLVSLLHIWLHWWGASLIVLAIFLLAAAFLARRGMAGCARSRTRSRPYGGGWTAISTGGSTACSRSRNAGRGSRHGERREAAARRAARKGSAMSQILEAARREAERRLEESRREAELRLAEVRTAVKTEVGVLPKRKYILMALAAGAAGFAVAVRRGRRRGGNAGKTKKLKK